MTSYFEDVGAFHAKFGLPTEADPVVTAPLSPSTASFRIAFMIEELAEFCVSQGDVGTATRLRNVMLSLREGTGSTVEVCPPGGLADGGDALVDLVYVALGTAHLMRLPFEQMWAEVQRANLSKERATSAADPRSKRGHALDVVKPEGWRGPEHWPLIAERTSKIYHR